MKFTKGTFGQTERFQHWLAPFQKTVTAQRFYALIIPDGKSCCAVWSKGFEVI